MRKPATYEIYSFAVEDWSFSYYQSVHKAEYHESRHVTVRGPLLSRTKRKIKRVELTIWVEDRPDPQGVIQRGRIGGSSGYVRDQRLEASVSVSPAVFADILVALSAKKILAFQFAFGQLEKRPWGISSVLTLDSVDDLEDE